MMFDTVWRTIDSQYFDPAMEGIDWPKVRREWRPLAAKAKSPAELYLDVLVPILDQFEASHVEIRPPRTTMLSNTRGFRMPKDKRGQPPVFITPADEAGMGAVLAWNGDAYFVDDVSLAGPAYASGLRPGQHVRFAGFHFQTPDSRVLDLIDTPSNGLFSITWKPSPKPPATEMRDLGQAGVFLRFNKFAGAEIDWTLAQISAAADRPIALDLRRNTGGLIDEVVRLLSALLPPGEDLGLFKSRERNFRLVSKEAAKTFTGRLAVLVGFRSMSGAEVSAGALQHHGRARLFGSRTSGNVLASQTFRLPDGGNLTVPFADYWSPRGDRIEKHGVTPDVMAPRTARSAADRSDPALDAAVTWLRSGQ